MATKKTTENTKPANAEKAKKPEKDKKSSGESFVGNVMKYSIATYLGFGITGAALIVKGILPAESYGVPVTFMTYTASLMNLGILGLDQALLRFYHEPPDNHTGRELFTACTRLSVLFMAALGLVCSLFFSMPIMNALGFGNVGPMVVPLLFINAALYMLVRYLNVLLRLENNIAAYTAETLWMQGCFNLFYLLPGFFTHYALIFILTAIVSFGIVILAFWFKARQKAQAESDSAPTVPQLSKVQRHGIYRTMLPYGIALAPAQILFSLSSGICLSFLMQYNGELEQGLFAFAYSLAQLVTAVQAGFSTYWGPYVYSHYREEQERIARVHDILNLLIFGFFCLLIMFEDIIFLIFPSKAACMAVLPLLMLAVVFNILCEGTVYGNSIARKPYHDTIGIAVGAASNFELCLLLVPSFGMVGAAVALAASNGCMFLYRTVLGQYYYRTIPSYTRTISGFLLAIAVTAAGVVFAGNFLVKLSIVAAILLIYCSLYRPQLAKLWQMARGMMLKYLVKK